MTICRFKTYPYEKGNILRKSYEISEMEVMNLREITITNVKETKLG